MLDIIIFGGVGDLSLRKLLPSLYYLHQDGKLPADCRILCVSRKVIEHEDFLSLIKKKLVEFLNDDFNDATWHSFRELLQYLKVDLADTTQWTRLVEHLKLNPSDEGRNVLYYLSVPPSLFVPICKNIKHHALNPEYSRVVVEKPLGEDYVTAQDVNDVLADCFLEKQIFRIDHYLGKQAIRNILKIRKDNKGLELIWNNKYIEKIEITVAETVGVEGRFEFLDRVGTLRDMVQNHLMQILSYVAMELPKTDHADDVRDCKVAAIKALRKINNDNVLGTVIRGQYSSGEICGQAISGYLDEIAELKDKVTGTGETFVAIKTFVDNEKWQGVPFYLRTGKRMANRFAEVRIKFKSPDNKFIIEIHPSEKITSSSELNVSSLVRVSGQRIREAYEVLLDEAIKQDQSLFVRDDEIMASWIWIDGIRDAWKNTNQPLVQYKAGSMGPNLD